MWNLKKKGFTVIELIIVISIFGLLASIILPNMSLWYSSLKINNAKRDFISNVRLVQQNAVTSQTNYSIKIESGLNRYSLIKKGTPDEVLKTVQLPVNISFGIIALAPSGNEVEFNSAGAPSSIGTVTMTNNQGKSKAVEITPSGFVKEVL